jgi:hypothetical protein
MDRQCIEELVGKDPSRERTRADFFGRPEDLLGDILRNNDPASLLRSLNGPETGPRRDFGGNLGQCFAKIAKKASGGRRGLDEHERPFVKLGVSSEDSRHGAGKERRD